MIEVIKDTLKIIKRGIYTDKNGDIHLIEEPTNTLPFYAAHISSNFSKNTPEISVEELDSLVAAQKLILSGYEPDEVTVLNMASWKNPGGGVLKGSKAQEEDICRRTNLLSSIGRGSKILSSFLGLDYNKDLYPLIETNKTIISTNVTVFKEPDTYELITNPFQCNIITMAAIQNPKLINGRLSEEDRNITKNKIISLLLHSSTVIKSKAVVLGAFGCGAYHNPPREIAEIFKEVLEEGVYLVEKVVFAILDKKPTDKNYKIFKEVLGCIQ